MRFLLFAVMLLFLLAAAAVFLTATRLRKRPLTGLTGYDYAHRGLWGGAIPENSLPAFRAAAEAGYGIELDVQLTADRQLLVFHDDSLERMCHVARDIRECSLADLRELRLAGTDEHIPSFADALAAVDGRVPLIVEIKSCKRISLLCELADRQMRAYHGPCCVESFDPRAVRWFRRHHPEMIRGQLAFGLTRDLYQKRTLNRFLASMTGNTFGRPDFIAFDIRTADSRPFRFVKRLFRPWTVAWTVSDQQTMNSLRSEWDLQIFEGFRPARRS